MMNKIITVLLAIGLVVTTINLYLAKQQIDSLGNTVDEINIMLKDFNDG